MTNRNCTIECIDSDFTTALADMSLVVGDHCNSEEPSDSLTECIHRAVFNDDVPAIVDALLTNGEHAAIDQSSKDLYRRGLAFEFGIHRQHIQSGYYSIVGLLCAISRIFGLDLYVVCSLFPLRMIRNNRKIIKFSFSDLEDPINVVVGLMGMHTFHHVVQEEPDSECWNLLNDHSAYFGINEMRDGTPRTRVNEDVVVGDVEELELLDEEGDLDDLSDVTGRDTRAAMRDITVSDFITRSQTRHHNEATTLNDEIYTSQTRINFERSHIQEFEANPINLYQQVFDIDGFFGYYKWHSRSIFKGNAKVIPHPMIQCKREMKSFRKVYTDSGKTLEFGAIFIKIADLVTNFGQFDFFFAGPLREDINLLEKDSLIRKVADEAFRFALNVNCIDNRTKRNIHPGCKFHSFRANVDAHRPTSVGKKKRKPEQFDSKRFGCFCYHFGHEIERLLHGEGIRLRTPIAYVQMVAMKSTLYAKNLYDLSSQAQKINQFFDLEKMSSFFDFSISTIATLNDSSEKVFY